MVYKFIFTLGAITLLVYIVIQLLEIEKEKNKIIKVQITLDNKCEFFDKVFMVKAIPSGKSARFVDKKAEMFLKKSSKVQLVVSDEFPGFHFTSIPVDVSYNTKLVADCSNSERLDNIFESLKNQFNKDAN
tara:strand:+ start:551 stop:943 length:393 start_codon:yes stop_codon:yes gene_type:complete